MPAHGARSAGLLVHRAGPDGDPQVLLAHHGGPFWTRRERSWTIPKGEYGADEAALDAARREFAEELGQPPPAGEPLPLGEVRQAGGKIVIAWAVRGDLDVMTVVSNTVELEWPPRSGRRQSFPEIDRAAWFSLAEARGCIIEAQASFLDRLVEALPRGGRPRD